MAALHQRGIDLLLNIMDAADHVETLSTNDVQRLLRATADVLGPMLERDRPTESKNDDVPLP